MEQENEKRRQPINNFYGKIKNYTVYEAPVTITYEGPVNNYDGTAEEEKKDNDDTMSLARMANAVEKVQQYFWATSALATIFCVCRDRYGVKVTASEFERQMEEANIHCPEGTIKNAMKNNPFMKLHIDKWALNGAQGRVMFLIKKFKEAVDTECEEMTAV